jgi:hypothetical protein
VGKRKTAKGTVGLGWGPSAIIIVLLIASLHGLALGRTLTQVGMRLGLVAALVGVIYLAWFEMAIRNPAFRMGVAGESTVILAIAAAGLIFVADPIASSVGLTLIPHYETLQMIGSDAAEFSVANTQLTALFLVVAAVTLLLLLYRMRKK